MNFQGAIVDSVRCSSVHSYCNYSSKHLTSNLRLYKFACRYKMQKQFETPKQIKTGMSGLIPPEELRPIKVNNSNNESFRMTCSHTLKSTSRIKFDDIPLLLPRSLIDRHHQPVVSRLPRYVVRPATDQLTNIDYCQWKGAFMEARSKQNLSSVAASSKPIYKIVKSGKFARDIANSALAALLYPPKNCNANGATEGCYCGTASKPNDYMDSMTSLTLDSPLNPNPVSEPLIASPSTPDYEDLQLLSVKNLKSPEAPSLSLLADISSKTHDDVSEKLAGRKDEIRSTSSIQTPHRTEVMKKANSPAVPVCKANLNMLPPRHSAYKDPNAFRDRKKVRLAIRIHPKATLLNCDGSQREFPSPRIHKDSSSNSTSDSHTECSRSITTHSIGDCNLTSYSDSCTISEIYDYDAAELKSSLMTMPSEVKNSDFTEKLFQECSLSTPSSSSVGQNWGHGDGSLIEPPEIISVVLNPSRKGTPFEKPSGDENNFETLQCSPALLFEAPSSVLGEGIPQFSIPLPTSSTGPILPSRDSSTPALKKIVNLDLVY